MKKLTTIATGLTMLAVAGIVGCSKKNADPVSAKGSPQNHTAAREYEVPANPHNPPPVAFLEGPSICFSQTCQSIELGFGQGPCDEDNGYICNWTFLPCEECNAAITIPHAYLDTLTTGVIYFKIRIANPRKLPDLSGTGLAAHDNIRLNADFEKALSCEAVFLLQGEYSYLDSNIAVLPVYIVNHTL